MIICICSWFFLVNGINKFYATLKFLNVEKPIKDIFVADKAH